MKKTFYVIAFTFLGILVQFLVHALVEIIYIKLLLQDFSRYSLSLSWAQWYLVHSIGSVALLVVGALVGFWQGKFWWPRIYNNK